MTDETGAAEQRYNQPENVYNSIADALLYGGISSDNELMMTPPDYESELPEWTGDRPGEDRGYKDWAVPLAFSFLAVGAAAAGGYGVAAMGGRAALSVAIRSHAARAGIDFATAPTKFISAAKGTKYGTIMKFIANTGYGVAGGMGLANTTSFDFIGSDDKSEEELLKEAKNELEKELKGYTQISEGVEISDKGYGLADYAILAEQAGMNDSNFRTEMPLFYGNIKLTDKGMFAESEAADVAGQAIVEGAGDKADLDQYLVPPLASSAGRTLGAMTVRWYDIYAPISEPAIQAGLGLVQQPGRATQGVFYDEDQIGEEQIIGRQMLGPEEELPEAGLGRRYEEREAEMDYGIDDALAYYKGLEPEQQRDFAMGLVALGYMGFGSDNLEKYNADWLVNPDAIIDEDAIAYALSNVAETQAERVGWEAGDAGMKGLDTTNQLRNSYLPILGYEGGLFDNEKAVIKDWDLFLQEAREKADYIKQVDVPSIIDATNQWAYRVYGRSANDDEQGAALNAATVAAENSVIGPNANRRMPDGTLESVATGSLGVNREEALQNSGPLISRALGDYITRNSRGLVR